MIAGWLHPPSAAKALPSSFPTTAGVVKSRSPHHQQPSLSAPPMLQTPIKNHFFLSLSTPPTLQTPIKDHFFLVHGFRRSLSNPLTSGIIAVYALFCFDPASAVAPHVIPPFPCEDAVSYYSGVDGLEGAPLLKALSSIVSPHRSLPYNEVWDALKILDAADVDNPEISPQVIEIYSSRAVPKILAGKSEGWNREHLWPRSYGLRDGPSLTDLHNLRPADVNVNSSRGNKYYGDCVATSTYCLRPAHPEAAPDTETDNQKWAPPYQVKGDIARSLMYMAVCYAYHQPDGSPLLQLSDSPNIGRREMGLLSDLLRWNELDPPSRLEQLRNDRICRIYQQNRNPFVDHPEYANLIWRRATQSSSTIYNPLEAWINEFHYKNKGKDRNEFVEIIVGPSTDAAALKLILYNGANGKMYKSLPLADDQAFTIRNCGSGFLIYTAFLPLQNGPADGIALVSGSGQGHLQVVQFLSYEGIVEATDGPAKGLTSIDIMVQETGQSSGDDSLGLAGRGVGEFEWRNLLGEATPGKLNDGQIIH